MLVPLKCSDEEEKDREEEPWPNQLNSTQSASIHSDKKILIQNI